MEEHEELVGDFTVVAEAIVVTVDVEDVLCDGGLGP